MKQVKVTLLSKPLLSFIAVLESFRIVSIKMTTKASLFFLQVTSVKYVFICGVHHILCPISFEYVIWVLILNATLH